MIKRMFLVHGALAGAFHMYIRPIFIFTAVFVLLHVHKQVIS